MNRDEFRAVERDFVRRARMFQADWSSHLYAEGIEYDAPDPPVPDIITVSMLKVVGEAVLKVLKDTALEFRHRGE